MTLQLRSRQILRADKTQGEVRREPTLKRRLAMVSSVQCKVSDGIAGSIPAEILPPTAAAGANRRAAGSSQSVGSQGIARRSSPVRCAFEMQQRWRNGAALAVSGTLGGNISPMMLNPNGQCQRAQAHAARAPSDGPYCRCACLVLNRRRLRRVEALRHRYLRITNWCGSKSRFTNRVPSDAVCTSTSPVPPCRNVIFDDSGCKIASTTTRSCRVAFETLYATSTSSVQLMK
jgi:hypothetical protein